MEIIKLNPKRIERKKINYIAKSLKKGEVVILPTDTCYGLSVNALNFKAIEKVFRIKGRLEKNPLSIIIKNVSQAREYSITDKRTKILFSKFLPGPLTIIVQKKKNLPNILTSGKNSVGLRIPDNLVIKKIMKEIDFPITATSANISGLADPYSIEEILKQYKKNKILPDLIVDAGRLKKVKPSTIIDLTEDKIRLIRQGPIKYKDVVNIIRINE